MQTPCQKENQRLESKSYLVDIYGIVSKKERSGSKLASRTVSSFPDKIQLKCDFASSFLDRPHGCGGIDSGNIHGKRPRRIACAGRSRGRGYRIGRAAEKGAEIVDSTQLGDVLGQARQEFGD